MPIVDMPLEELKKYGGMNPCPPDMDEFWNRALAEMEALDPQVELIPSKEFHTRNAECFDFYFTGVGGARVHAQYVRPVPDGKKHPAVLLFHGYTGSCGDWSHKLRYVNNGMCAAAMDVRGQGGKSEENSQVSGNTFRGHIIRGLEDEPEKLLFRQIFLDTALLARIVMSFEEVDENRVGACGGSQGGALSLACASLTPDLNRISVQYPFLCDYKRVWHMDLGGGAYEELKAFFRATDPRHKKEEETFLKLGYIDLQYLVKRIRADVLWAVGLMDTTCPPSTQFAAYNKVTAKKELLVYPDFGHEGLPGIDDETFMFMEKMLTE